MKRVVVFLLAAVFAFGLSAQGLYMPLEFQRAIEKGTRTKSGVPGPEYWINHADYHIKANFDPDKAYLTGEEVITYYNDSPDTLKQLVIRVYQDFFKKGAMRDFALMPGDIHDGVKINSFSIDSQSYKAEELRYYSDLMFVRLKKPIPPHSVARVEIAWEEPFPTKRPIRYGKYDEKTFFIGYWYPEIAVYDDVFGWDARPFTGMQEFFNDPLNNFHVEITVPAPNVVWASGVLMNPDQVFNRKIIERINKAKNSDEIIHIITPKDLKKAKILVKKQGALTWIFEGKHIEEFAFAMSDHHVWDGSGLKMPDGRHVFISAAYNPGNKEFARKAWLARQIIENYSYKTLKVPFPYPKMTVFNGGGAMEYPMMVNEANFPDSCGDTYVTAHEIGHTYFPFLTGSNETFYAWMDEGIINFIPRFVAQDIFPDKCQNIFRDMVRRYASVAGTIDDFPIMASTGFVYFRNAYRHIAYNRPAFAFYQLVQYFGEQAFFKALREYTQRWEYKHPYPYDFFYTFNQVLGQDLSWFWRPYFFEFAYPDLGITIYDYTDGQLTVTIKNKGGLPMPVKLTITLANGSQKVIERRMDVWKDRREITITVPLQQKPQKIELDGQLGTDRNMSDNVVMM